MTDNRLALTCLAILAGVATGFALHWLKPVMIPLVFAGVLTLVVQPVSAGLSRHLRLPRWAAMFLAFGLAAGVVVGLGLLISQSARAFLSNSDQYAARLVVLSDQVEAWAGRFGLDLGGVGVTASQVTDYAKVVARGALSFFTTFFLVMVCLLFLLQGQPRAPRAGGLRAEVVGRVRRYLVIKVGTSLVTGVLVGLILWGVGLDLAVTFGVLTFLLNFIPSVGSMIAALLPAPLVLLDPSATWLTYALVFGLPGTVHMVIGNVVEPRLMGESLELHPVSILLGLIFWGMLWGVPGMFLAAPLTAILKIVLGHHPVTAPIGRLLGGQMEDEPPGLAEAGAPAEGGAGDQAG